MAIVYGRWDFIVRNLETNDEDEVSVYDEDIEVESTQTDTEDDKQRESVYLMARVHAFDGDVSFTVRQYFDVFGPNVFNMGPLRIEDIAPGHFAVSVDTSDPESGVSVEASPLQTEE